MAAQNPSLYRVLAAGAMIFFSILIHAQPSNDDPCDAAELKVPESCYFSRFTNLNATASGVPDPGCGNYLGADVWFRVEIPESGTIEIQTDTRAMLNFPSNDGWLYRGAMAIYTGECGSLSLIECNLDNSSYHSRMPGATLTDLIPGDKLWIRIWDYDNSDNGMFDICVFEPEEPEEPQPYDVSGGGSFCQGDTGVSVMLSDSELGILYTLILNDNVRLDTLAGTGVPLIWTPLASPGTYKVEAENPDNNSLLMMNGTAQVEVLTLPQLSAIVSDATCAELNNGSIDLTVNAPAPYFFEWTGPSGFTSGEEDLTGLAPGSYLAAVTDSNYCVNISPPYSITEPSQLVISLNSITQLSSYEATDGSVDISIAGGAPPYSILWTGTDDYTSILEDPDSMSVGFYRVQVTDQQLCTNSMEGIRLSLEENTDEIFIPESFSPNGDGYNDNFVILGIENFEDNELMVFNGQGVTVYYRANYQNDWDGTPEEGRVLGGVLPEGTYYYIFKYGENGIRKGFVYINRK